MCVIFLTVKKHFSRLFLLPPFSQASLRSRAQYLRLFIRLIACEVNMFDVQMRYKIENLHNWWNCGRAKLKHNSTKLFIQDLGLLNPIFDVIEIII